MGKILLLEEGGASVCVEWMRSQSVEVKRDPVVILDALFRGGIDPFLHRLGRIKTI